MIHGYRRGPEMNESSAPSPASAPSVRARRQFAGWLAPFALVLALTRFTQPATAAAYGSLNNFDAVNDNGVPCHGFEIELEDLQSVDIADTFNWNHYGTPTIIEDTTSVPGHPRVIVRYAATRNPDGSWSAFTAVPSGPIAPTDGHQFTDPSANFGGEHFGVGFLRPPSVVRYHWLVEDGAGGLIHGTAVNIATPAFTYQPPAAGAPAQVQAVIAAPPPPEVHLLEFGPATWVKEIRTTTHNARPVKLRDLVSDDPDDPTDTNWRNGEPDEVEVEWQLLQIEFNKLNGGKNGALAGAPEVLRGGDEVVTRRYEFFKYTGPLDEETGEAMAEKVGPDGRHGAGHKTINGVDVNLATVEVVGDYIGAQMSAVDVQAPLGLIEHLQDGEANQPYPTRTVVLGGGLPFTSQWSGELPVGLSFDAVTGVLSGTPLVSGLFQFTVTANDGNAPELTRTYTLRIAEAGVELPPASMIELTASPLAGGPVTGSGAYDHGVEITVTAAPLPGYAFDAWLERGAIVSREPVYRFTTDVHRALVAHFLPAPPAAPALTLTRALAGGLELAWPATAGWRLQESTTLNPPDWTDSTRAINHDGNRDVVQVPPAELRRFFRLVQP